MTIIAEGLQGVAIHLGFCYGNTHRSVAVVSPFQTPKVNLLRGNNPIAHARCRARAGVGFSTFFLSTLAPPLPLIGSNISF